MVVDRRQIQLLVEHAAHSYGFDFVLPRGQASGRMPRTTPVAEPATRRADHPDVLPGPTVAAEPAVPNLPRPATSPAPSAAAPAPNQPAATAPPAAADEAAAALQALRQQVLPCTRCKLHEGRLHAVFGEGNPRARVMFIGEAPGATEDQTGRPFVGAAGQLLDRILTGAMGLQRQDVYIANVNKCRPPGNREPAPDEVAACLPFLRAQIECIRPEVIVCLGRVAAQNLLGSHESASRLRGRTLDYLGVPVIVTWHPAYLLRDPSHKRETWEDIKRVNRLLGLPDVPAGGASG